ncbi:hypothetical protein pb186bvf_017950 [Paramecium bursaria]
MGQQQSQELEGQEVANMVAKHLDNFYRITGREMSDQQCRMSYSLASAPNRSTQKNYTLLKASSLKDLQINQINQGLELEGMIILPSFKMVGHMLIIMDKNNDIELTAVYNVQEKDVIKQLGLGNLIGIKNPFYKIASDGFPLIRVDNPNDVIVKESNHNLYLQKLEILVEMCQSHDQALKLLKQFSSKLQIKDFENQVKQLNTKIQNTKLIPFQQQQKQKQPGEDYLDHHQKQQDNSEMDMNQLIEMKEIQERDPNYMIKFLAATQMVQTNLNAAISMYQDLIRQNDSYAFINFNLSELCFQQGDFQKTIIYGKKFIELHERKKFNKSKIYGFAYYQIGLSQLFLGQIDESEKNLLRASELYPQEQTFIFGLAQYYYKIENFIQSEKYCLQSIKLKKNNRDSFIETSRSYLYLFGTYQKMKNMIKLIESGQKLIELDDNNIFVILQEFKLLLVDNEYTFEEKLQLINHLEKTEEFDIIAEELYEILILHSNDIQTKTTAFKQYAITYQVQQDQDQDYSKADVIDKVVLEIEQDETNHQLLDERRSYVLKPLKQQNQKFKQKKKQAKDIVEKNQELKDETSKYPGFIGKVDNICQKKTYVILFDLKLNFDCQKLRLKFIQASLKWSKSNFNSSGIKYIKEAKLYEVKLCGKNGDNGKRLLCEQTKQDGAYTILNFDKLMSHQDAERRIANRK